MKLKNILLTTIITLSGSFSGCGKKPIIQEAKLLAKDIRLTEIVKDSFSLHHTDAQKIIEYNKLLNEYKDSAKISLNYLIVNKKKCNAVVYSPKGDTLQTFEVILGKSKGDKRAGGYWNHEKNPRCYTTPGEYTMNHIGSQKGSSNERLYKNNVFWLKGDHTEKASLGKQATAVHQIPDSRVKQNRLNALNSGSLEDNRKSFGCVELTSQDCETLKTYIKPGSKIYILPEEKGNSLNLEKQQNNTYKFFQRKYRKEQ